MVFGWYNFPSVLEIASGKVVKGFLNAWCFSGYFSTNNSRAWRFSSRTDITFRYFFFFNDVTIVQCCMGSWKLTSRESNLFFIKCSYLPVLYFLAVSSPFVILLGISASVAMFRAAPLYGNGHHNRLSFQ